MYRTTSSDLRNNTTRSGEHGRTLMDSKQLIARLFYTMLCITTLSTTVVLSACNSKTQEHEYTIFVFGTLVDITLYDVEPQQADNTFEQLRRMFEKNHEDWSPWTDGDLARLNQKLKHTGTEIMVPEHLLPIIKTSISLSEKSDGLFNPAIGELINLWQFHRYQEKGIQPPDEHQIQRLVESNPQMGDLKFNTTGSLINSNQTVSLNFGAFAKGYAIEQGLKFLKKSGINNAIINAGGDLSVIGQHGDRAWNIGIRHPRKDEIFASVEVGDGESVFTSGDYERFYYFGGRRFHHILDPRTGHPTDDARSVTVIHDDAGVADAAATALFVAGRDHWQVVAKQMGVQHVMLIDSDGDIHVSGSMQKRIKFLDNSSTSRIIVDEAL